MDLIYRSMSLPPFPVIASTLIEKDIRNNSAWNERWFATHRGERGKFLCLDDAQREANFALKVGSLDPYNESPLQYLIAILREQIQSGNADVELISDYEAKVCNFCNVLKKANRDPDACFNLTSARIDLLEMVGDKSSLEKVS